jgi:NADPH oxidase
MQLGRRFGVDAKQPILRVDGPYSTPTEHFSDFNSIILVGAGIGITPFASVLRSLLKYRWRYGGLMIFSS